MVHSIILQKHLIALECFWQTLPTMALQKHNSHSLLLYEGRALVYIILVHQMVQDGMFGEDKLRHLKHFLYKL